MNEALARLDEYLTQADFVPMVVWMADNAINEKPEFRIETKEQAIWALRKIAGIERGRKEAREAAQAEIDRIKTWLEEEERRADRAREYLDELLEDYHRRQLAENPRAKTIKLPHGELQLRAQQPEFQRDEEAVKAWARENRPDVLIPQEPKLDWSGLKKSIQVAGNQCWDQETGEVIPGITVIERPLKFQIKLTGV